MSVLIETTMGDIVIDLFVKERPTSCQNFLKLCKIKYYNLCQIFLIEPNYIVQTGDPTNTGRGGESIFGKLYGDQARFFETEEIPKLKHTHRGLVSFVNNGSGQLGSQFFITLADNLDYLDNKHCIFGQVAEGLDTLDSLNAAIVDEENHPFRDIRIAHTIILADPFADPPRLPVPSRSPSPTIDIVKVINKIALDEKDDENEGKSMEEIQKEMEAKEMKAQAQILEMIGDLHHADERPPDNVLFVCKLNPVTQSEDLEIIFGRFGTIVECEVIKDKRTGQSLQYAFIEFEAPKQCEAAYLKMDNVLIDDRRIHVDFSQSVAKNFQWKRRGGPAKKEVSDGSRSRSPSPKKPRRRSSTPPRRRSNQDVGRERERGRYRDDRREGRRRELSPRSSRSDRHRDRRENDKVVRRRDEEERRKDRKPRRRSPSTSSTASSSSTRSRSASPVSKKNRTTSRRRENDDQDRKRSHRRR